MNRRTIYVTTEELARLRLLKDAYERFTGVRYTWGQFLLAVGAPFYSTPLRFGWKKSEIEHFAKTHKEDGEDEDSEDE